MGTELTMRLPLPFCRECAPSARRRPQGFFSWLLIWIVAAGVIFASAVVLALSENAGKLPHLLVDQPLIPLSLGFVVSLIPRMLRRRSRGQSSFSQPVQLKSVSKNWRSGAIKRIEFLFTSKEFEAAFVDANKGSIGLGAVVVSGHTQS
jgi:hypothetical protein